MKTSFLAALVLLWSGAVFGDGMPIENGRFVGKVTVITLTKEQKERMAENRARIERWRQNPTTDQGEWNPRISLTPGQRAQLQKESGQGPELFLFYETRFGENDCTCHAANNALRFNEAQAEIPHEYLKTDEEVRKLEKQMEGA